MARKLPKKSKCPQCGKYLSRTTATLKKHFLAEHKRMPTPGENNQFATSREGQTPYSGKDFAKPKCEVSGGGFSKK